jgi:predicted DNA-binding transcriptional regulator AlpA
MQRRVYRVRDLCSTAERAGLLPVSQATLWRWVREGRFPRPFKLGERVTVWDAQEVEAYLRAQRQRQA